MEKLISFIDFFNQTLDKVAVFSGFQRLAALQCPTYRSPVLF